VHHVDGCRIEAGPRADDPDDGIDHDGGDALHLSLLGLERHASRIAPRRAARQRGSRHLAVRATERGRIGGQVFDRKT
jgi:hypothetical protein